LPPERVTSNPHIPTLKSNKQRKPGITASRVKRKAAKPVLSGDEARKPIPTGSAPCNPHHLAPYSSYGSPDFVQCGYYTDLPFQCARCLKQEIWTATRQKWWYEVAKGSVESRAKLCNACRNAERARRDEARRVHVAGLQAKRAKKTAGAHH
jgi:Probable zinc-ribbon domain